MVRIGDVISEPELSAEPKTLAELELPPLSRETPREDLVIYQPSRGFRYSMDPFLLASWALEGGQPGSVVDMGTGSGVMALLLARLGVSCTGVDVRPEWVAMARHSAAESELDNVQFVQADVRTWDAPPVDLVVCNPPYFPAGRGPKSSDPLKAHARHELAGSLSDLIGAAAAMAPRVCLVLPASRSREAAKLLARHGLPLSRRMRLEPSLVLLEGRADAVPGEACEEIVPMRSRGRFHSRVVSMYARLGVVLS